jgi:hypothetical protein
MSGRVDPDPEPEASSEQEEVVWDFAGTRRQHILRGLRMTPVERLRWLEETVDEMRRLQGLARLGRPIDDPER